MTQLVEMMVEGTDGPPQLVRVEIKQVGDGVVQVARPGRAVVRAEQAFGEMLAGIRPVAESLIKGFRGMADAPDQIGAEFGLSFTAQADLVISSAAAAATFKVTLAWTRPPVAAPDSDPAPDPAQAVA
ncbi:MAG TPA: CU044_2847 family protein [Actinocrinis sp.]|nr:CU044_2847 family protein [Actinocrinis sp.]